MTIDKCPCCNGEPFAKVTMLANKEDCKKYYIMCRKCGLETSLYDTLQQAAEAWNRRYK